MKLLLAFTPFHTPTSPPFGLAYLKAALTEKRPDVDVQTIDWNLEFFRRWLRGEMPDPCRHHPTQLLGAVCPSLIVENGLGEMILDDLSRLPTTPKQQDRYMQAARLLDDVYNRLAGFYHDILFPFVEGRAELSTEAEDALFGAELTFVEDEQPDVVGFSILAEQNLLYALALGRVIHKRFGIPIALGGAMMSHLAPAELLRGFPWIDFVFFGEAEASIVEFADAWGPHPPNPPLPILGEGGTVSPPPDFGGGGVCCADLGGGGQRCELEGIRGLAHRRDGEPCVHQRPQQLALDRLPLPDFSDFPLHDYLAPEPVLPIITSRGCYWGKCTFCSHTLPYGPGVRVRRPVHVVDEMAQQVARYGVRRFLFVDEAISPRTLTHLSREILARDLDVRFGAEGVRVERAFDASLLETAHEAGLRWVYVGIESSVQRLLDHIEKGITIETIERFIATCERVGITPQLSFIIGLPSTTREELEEEIEFLKRYPVDASPFVLLLGSPMQQRPDDFGIRIEDQQVLYATPHGPVHAPRFYFTVEEGLSPAVADALVEQAGPRRRMRPHLGEVHATLLADTDFFDSEARPPAPAPAAEIALHVLSQQRAAGQADGQWFLHIAGCLEEQGRLEEALTVVQAGLATAHDRSEIRDPFDWTQDKALQLHVATILNRAGQPQQVLQVLAQVEGGVERMPALRAERVRALYALDRPADVIREAEAMLEAGHEVRWMHYILGQCYAALNQPAKGLESLDRAEARDWLEPEINEAKARCLQVLNRGTEARRERAKVRRKQGHLGG